MDGNEKNENLATPTQQLPDDDRINGIPTQLDRPHTDLTHTSLNGL